MGILYFLMIDKGWSLFYQGDETVWNETSAEYVPPMMSVGDGA
jgi:hypothetical protein